MNGVDCKDQRIETMVCSRKEHKMSALMYTHVLDFSLSNAYALYLFCMEITKFIGPKHSYSDFRMSVARSLTQDNAKKRENEPKNNTTGPEIPIGDNLKHCSLLLIGNSKYICYFCSEFVIDAPTKQRTTYGCPICKVGFCNRKNCYTYFHEISHFDEIKAKLVEKNMKKKSLPNS